LIEVNAPKGDAVNKKTDDEIARIEETQEALRDSIEESKRLADKTQELLQQHKKALDEDDSGG
jgi:ABC-type transporter Mla subunit MlaD